MIKKPENMTDKKSIEHFKWFTDKFGKKIKLGDILSCYCPFIERHHTTSHYVNRVVFSYCGVLIYTEGSMTWEIKEDNWKSERVEIVGNINERRPTCHQEKEPLKKLKKKKLPLSNPPSRKGLKLFLGSCMQWHVLNNIKKVV